MVPVIGAVALVACSQSQATTSTSTKVSFSPSPSATQATVATAGSDARCAMSQLKIALNSVNGATGNEIARLTMTSTSGSTCYLLGYPVVQLLDSTGHDLQDAQAGTDSFFGAYPAPRRVDLRPGGTTTFDLTYSGIDPCGNYGPAQRPVSLKIAPPGDFDSASIPANVPGQMMIVCPSSLAVHPVGSKPLQG